MERLGAVLQAVLFSLLVASVVFLSLRVARIEGALAQRASGAMSDSAELQPGVELAGIRAIGRDRSKVQVELAGRKLLFVYSTSCPYSRQMFPVWARMGERAGQQQTVYLSVDDPAAQTAAVGSTPENGFLLPRESPLRGRFGRVPQTIVVADGRVVSVDIGVLPPEAIERVLNDLNTSR